MPRANPIEHRRAIRAYHRASAALRELHREEWEALRAQFLGAPDNNGEETLKPGPSQGRKLFAASYRVATQEDLVEARLIIEEAIEGTRRSPSRAVLRAFEAAGFLLMRAAAHNTVEEQAG